MNAIICPGTYGGHLQGIALDRARNIYWSFTDDMVKTDPEGTVINHIEVPHHHGDICCHDNRVFVAVNLGEFNHEEDRADNWIYVYDTENLSLIRRYKIPEVFHGAGGMGYLAGNFFVVGGLPRGYDENYVYEYDEDFLYIRKHTLESGYTVRGIQTACRAYGYWWFGCYGVPAKMIKTDGSFNVIGMYEFDCSLGIIDLEDDKFLIGRTYGDDPNQGQALHARADEKNGLILI